MARAAFLDRTGGCHRLAGFTLRHVAEYPHPSSEGRSANMRANRRTDTKPELALRRALHRLGYRYRKDYRLDLESGRRGPPGIAVTGRKGARFVGGRFLHARPAPWANPRAAEF